MRESTERVLDELQVLAARYRERMAATTTPPPPLLDLERRQLLAALDRIDAATEVLDATLHVAGQRIGKARSEWTIRRLQALYDASDALRNAVEDGPRTPG